ncbi:MAG: hypothetical protein F6K31_18480 [Symploca sp. SIO2G7]|nr:hypothetical protein [Symploca sp. SIO2G7]
MKSKIRNIVVNNIEYTWAINELDWDTVALKVWVKGQKRLPWFVTEKQFNNPWYFIGQVNEENIEKFQLEPVTPKVVAAAIKQVVDTFGLPEEVLKTMHLSISGDGKVTSC